MIKQLHNDLFLIRIIFTKFVLIHLSILYKLKNYELQIVYETYRTRKMINTHFLVYSTVYEKRCFVY